MKEYILALEFFSKILTAAPELALLQHLSSEEMFAHWPVPVADKPAWLDQKASATTNTCKSSLRETNHMRRFTDKQGKEGLTLLQISMKTAPEKLYGELKKDFFELFEMSPARCHIHESVWLGGDHLLYDEQTFAVRACYAKYGLQAINSDRGPDDHLALELNFVAYLLNLLETQENREDVQQDLQHFLDAHLLLWGPDCFLKIAEEAETSFYRGVGLLGVSTLAGLKTKYN